MKDLFCISIDVVMVSLLSDCGVLKNSIIYALSSLSIIYYDSKQREVSQRPLVKRFELAFYVSNARMNYA